MTYLFDYSQSITDHSPDMLHFIYHKRFILITALSLGAIGASAQSANKEVQESPSIVERINSSDHHQIDASPDILKLLMPGDDDALDKSKNDGPAQHGPRMRTIYRVQILSVNQSGNGRALAEKGRRAVSSRFPQYPCDLAFEAPNWKVRVGIFENQNDANAAASKIRQSLSQYAKEVRVVRVNMKVTK